MVEYRIAFVTDLYIGLAVDHPALVLVQGYPNAASLQEYFVSTDLIQESCELAESSENTPHGEVISYQLRCRVGRESDFWKAWIESRCMAAVELANGEKILLGSREYPLLYSYSRTSGVQQTDSSDSTLIFQTSIPAALLPG
jgi:hypothetical protein